MNANQYINNMLCIWNVTELPSKVNIVNAYISGL